MYKEDIGKIYPPIRFYSRKKENKTNISLPKENNNTTYFIGTLDKYSDKNVILNPTFSKTKINKLARNNNIAFKGFQQENDDFELSDEEFERMRPNIEVKLQKYYDYNNQDMEFNKYNILVANKILSADTKLYYNNSLMHDCPNILRDLTTPEEAKSKIKLIDKILSNGIIYNNHDVIEHIGSIIFDTHTQEQANVRINLMDKFLSDENLYRNITIVHSIGRILNFTNTKDKAEIVDKILSDENLYDSESIIDNFADILYETRSSEIKEIKLNLIDKYLKDENLNKNRYIKNNIGKIIATANRKEQLPILNTFFSDEKLYNNEIIANNISRVMYFTKTLDEANAKSNILKQIPSWEKLLNNGQAIHSIIDFTASMDKEEYNYLNDLINEVKENKLTPQLLSILLNNHSLISYKDIQKLRQAIGIDRVNKMKESDLHVAVKLLPLAGKESINEIPIEERRGVLRKLVANNTGFFNIPDYMAKDFPLIPKNQEEYCTLLPAIVRSLKKADTPVISETKVENLNNSISKLSQSLAKLSDNDFANLSITQEYSKDDFIKTVLSKVKDLPAKERQKVYDYYRFELQHNIGNKETGFSIIGYPINPNNGEKIAQITDPQTKEVVENLRSDVIRFTENNRIKANNPEVEQFLNEIVDVLPELRTTIGKTQHSTHSFDIMQHSLKVMQKVAQDPKFNELNDSDKKVMMLASLMHDIRKREGFSDPTHADESSFDTFYICKKLNLSKDEEIKLYTLIKHHEWLQYVNTVRDEAGNIIPEQLEKRLQSVAFDLQQENLFDMATIFTHADLKAVKSDDTFHDKTIGKGRIDEDGNPISYGDLVDKYAIKIKNYIAELQESQPFLPVTKIPAASVMKQAITNVNPDGSTNLKGVFVDKDGLVILKYNEVEDWEALGFPKGSVSRGIPAKGLNGIDIDTGNIKFFVHGLETANQIAKFDTFDLIDSDALLSVSYAERPESKYRFYRTQGVILDVDSQYVYGGGDTDTGSGREKSIDKFKNNYIFGGYRDYDRVYISNMIKEATGMNDTEYVEFIKENKNKPFTEIEPKDIKDKIIKALATINSNVRTGNREYNEMFISNPKVMGVFAYSASNYVGDTMKFVQRHSYSLDFLKKFALEHDIPMIIFGD